jgi:hypothetical protein
MKLFATMNSTFHVSSDFDLPNDFEPDETYSSNQHSGGIVILAESMEKAKQFLVEKGFRGTLKEIESGKEGIVLFADGDC